MAQEVSGEIGSEASGEAGCAGVVTSGDSENGVGVARGAGGVRGVRGVGLTADNRFRTGRLAGLTLGGAIWVLSWPVVIESFLNWLVGMTDTYIAAQLGEAQTDAIGVAAYFNWFVGLIGMSLGVGATAVISRSVGKGRMAVAGAALAQTLLLAVVLGVLGGLLLFVAAPAIAVGMGLNADASAAFVLYMRITSISVPFSAVLFSGIACARGAGDSVRPLHAMVVVNAVNVVGSIALSGVDLARTSLDASGETITRVILKNPSPAELGVAGIAIGTLLAHVVGSVIIVWMARSGVWKIRLRFRRLAPHWLTIGRLYRLGMPNFLETAGMWFGNFLVIVLVAMIAASAAASGDPGAGGGLFGAHIIAIRVEAISFLPGFAMSLAAATLAGQYLGAGRPDLARRGVWICMLLAVGFMGVLGVAFVLVPGLIVGLLSQQASHLELAPPLIIIAGVVQIPFAVAIVFRGAMRGAGDVKAVMLLTWLSTFAIRLPMVYVFSGVDLRMNLSSLGIGDGPMVIENPFPFEWGLTGVWIGLCGELVIRAFIFAARYMHGGWLKQRV